MSGVYTVSIPPLPSRTLFDQLLPCVDENRQEKISRFWRPEDAWRSLLAESLTRAAVVSATGIRNEQLSLRRDHNGKPSVHGGDGSFLSISHSGSLVVCVFDSHPIGIDVEEMVTVGEESAAVVLSPAERAVILPDVRAKRLSSFFELWTKKESYAKVSGSGHQIAFDAFSIVSNDGNHEIRYEQGTSEIAYFQLIPVMAGYLTCVCSLTHPMDFTVHSFSVEEIADTLHMNAHHA